ncbi:hypothetical protein K523DRAFT_363961 [Schizophyllum commune Tattone D]|nr:hypothetical protein K523DRAFT_363961 [Schizophyllum commune Tattone D]
MILPSLSLCAKCEHAVTACSYPDAPSLDLLRSQYAPPETERATLVSDIAQLDSWLANLDLDINAIEERLAVLHRVRAQVVIDREKKYGLLAPIRRLPNEILTHIVRAAVPPKWRSEGSATAPFPLINSCYRLRSIAHSALELWVQLIWPWHINKDQVQRPFLARAQLCNERAQNKGLDLTVSKFSSWISITDRYRMDIHVLQWVVSRLDRFRTLDYYVPMASHPTEALSAPLLERARLTCASDRYFIHHTRSTVKFGIRLDAPRLRQLELYHLLAPSRVHISWALLEELTLEIDCFGLADLKPLQSCTNLRSLRIRQGQAYWPEDEQDDADLVIRLGALRFLSLGECLQLCRFLVVPRLETLDLQPGIINTWFDSDIPAVREMLQNSGHPGNDTLQSISLTTHRLRFPYVAGEKDHAKGQIYLSVLRCMPAVRLLRLSYLHQNAIDLMNVLRALVVTPDAGPMLLPSLERLSIRLVKGSTTFDKKFAELLKDVAISRWATNDGIAATDDDKLTLRLELTSPNCGWHFSICRCATRGTWPDELKALGILVDQVPCQSVASEWQ